MKSIAINPPQENHVRKPTPLSVYRARWGIRFVSPFYILFAIFGLFPLIGSFILSFVEWKGVGPLTFVGLENYILMLSDKVFWQSMGNSIILFFMYAPLLTFSALVLATILNSRNIRGFRIFRTMIFMPYITNMVAAGYVFQLLLDKNYGVVNSILGLVNIPAVAWLDSPWGARIAVCLLIMWGWLGYHMVIMHAGLQTIPQDLTEAARVDGATPLQAFFMITVPLMRPILLFSILVSTIGSFHLFPELVALFPVSFGAGPLSATRTPALNIYAQGFNNQRFGYASTLAYTYFAFLFVITVLQYRYFGRERE